MTISYPSVWWGHFDNGQGQRDWSSLKCVGLTMWVCEFGSNKSRIMPYRRDRGLRTDLSWPLQALSTPNPTVRYFSVWQCRKRGDVFSEHVIVFYRCRSEISWIGSSCTDCFMRKGPGLGRYHLICYRLLIRLKAKAPRKPKARVPKNQTVLYIPLYISSDRNNQKRETSRTIDQPTIRNVRFRIDP